MGRHLGPQMGEPTPTPGGPGGPAGRCLQRPRASPSTSPRAPRALADPSPESPTIPVNTKQGTHVNTPRSTGSATLCSRNAHRWDRLASPPPPPPPVLGSGPFSEGLGLGTDLQGAERKATLDVPARMSLRRPQPPSPADACSLAFPASRFDEADCHAGGRHVGEGHVARSQGRPRANIQQGTEALGPTALKEPSPASEAGNGS